MQIFTPELTTAALGLLTTGITIGVLKQGQADNKRSLDKHGESQQKELAGLRETLDHIAVELHGAVTSAARHDERLGALERSTDRAVREETLAREELKGDLKRHGRELEGLKVWKAGVNQRLTSLDPNWRAD